MIGVGCQFRGLGIMLSELVRLKMPPHISDGLGRVLPPSMILLGRADSGVSIRSRGNGGLELGGAGRANGFGGPVAPAERTELFAEGDGGGSTTPLCVGGSVCAVADRVSLSDESSVGSPPSDCSLGICTLRRGRFAVSDCIVFDRVGGGIEVTEAIEDWRSYCGFGGACEVFVYCTSRGERPLALCCLFIPVSIECALKSSS